MSQAGGFIPGGGGGIIVYTITGNAGGAVSPFANNIIFVGDGTSINITGNPVTHALTANVIANRYVEALIVPGGTRVVPTTVGPTTGNITLVAGANIAITSAAPNTVTISSVTSIPVYTNVNATPYVVLATDEYLSVDTSALAITIQLPDAPAANTVFTIKDRTGNAAARNISVTTVTGVVLIDGLATQTLNTAYQAINVLFNGTSYEIF